MRIRVHAFRGAMHARLHIKTLLRDLTSGTALSPIVKF